jgi:hypothetical protein
MAAPTQSFDTLAFIMDVEGGMEDMTPERYIDGFAEMIRTRLAFNLQGSWGRAAQYLIDNGYIDRDGNVLHYGEDS